MRIPRVLMVVSMTLSIGCTSYTITKVADTGVYRNPSAAGSVVPVGVRFHLPKKYLYVEPQADGSIKAKFLYVKDPANAFAISGESRMQNNKLTVKVANGILTEVSFTQDDTAATKKLIESAAARKVAEITAEKTAKTAAEIKAKEQKTALETLDAAIVAAQLVVYQAQAELTLLEAVPKPDDPAAASLLADNILKAKIALEKAKLALTAAEYRRTKASDVANDVANATTMKNAYGPAFFEVKESADTVELVPVNEWPNNLLQLVVPVQNKLAGLTQGPVGDVAACIAGQSDFDNAFELETLDSGGKFIRRLKWKLEGTVLKRALLEVQDENGTVLLSQTYTDDPLESFPPDGFEITKGKTYLISALRLNGTALCNLSKNVKFS